MKKPHRFNYITDPKPAYRCSRCGAEHDAKLPRVTCCGRTVEVGDLPGRTEVELLRR